VSSITSLTITAAGSTNGTMLGGVELDGELLVDGGSFGANGFHLPFDPAATGANYSSKTTTSGLISGTINDVYNGAININSGSLYDAQPGSALILETTLGEVTSAGMWFGGRGSAQIRITGDTVETSPVQLGVNGQSNLYTYTPPSPVTNVTKIELISADAVDNVAFYGLEINRKLLVDHNNIGVDDSGQDNHFHDQNFAVGNTDEVWSRLVNVLLPANISSVLNNPVAMFNGGTDTSNLDNLYGLDPLTTGESWEINYPAGVITNGTYTIMGSNPDNIIYRFTLSNATVIDSQTLGADDKGDKTRYTITIPNGVSLTKITCENDGISSANTVAHFYNGEILVDANIQDTVLDTPMKNYAVLETGSNGNLVATANGTNLTYVGEAGTDYYYEADGVGAVHSGGTPFSSGNGKAYNFGQLPFVATFDDAQTWSDFLTPENSWLNSDRDNLAAFNGDANVSAVTSGNGDTMTFTYTLTNVDSISLWLERTNDVTVTDTNDVSHTFRTPALSAAKPGGEFTITKADLTAQGLSNNIKSISWFIVDLGAGSSGNTQLYALEVNGETLVDTGLAPDQSVTLHQTWEQWARTALVYAVDRIAKLEQRNIQLEALVEEARTRLAALELNEVSDDAVDTALITLIGNINDRLTVLEEGN
jgi:hypothetical protein